MVNGFSTLARHGFQGFVAIAGDADDDRFVTRNSSLLDQFLGHGDFGAAGGFGEDPFGAREQLDAVENFVVA